MQKTGAMRTCMKLDVTCVELASCIHCIAIDIRDIEILKGAL